MAIKKKNVKDHDARKSQGGHQKYKDANKDQNEARGKQTWVGGKVSDGGHWEGRD
jgi:hypothetical protein